ncbi:GNAT family N-acetyltransferase [Robiginitomaculum antarcticum]|uniref:GNAT family N-acetyltransferase n=1 Tax=Robiginitomaculum antarcticum TaxID=437507 RepID=UPI000378F925|nr:GNAT family N-acetyltransferase [Robiginitomaculum antarcticum]
MDNIEIEREETGRFVTRIDGHEAELTYKRVSDDVVDAYHTGVPKVLGGKGVGKALVAALFLDAQTRGYKVIPSCPFIASMAKRRAEWGEMVVAAD